MDTSEKNFEAAIEAALCSDPARNEPTEQGFVPGGYRTRKPEDYNRSLCLDPDVVLDFLYATQPKEWEKLKQHHGEDVKARFYQRLSSEIAKRGTLDVLRKGIKDSGCKFQLAYFRPATGLNEETQRLYEANQFTVIRQLHFSEKNEQSLDLGLFLNGIPMFTAELKNPFKGQDVQDAIRQYRFDRDPREPLFAFGRCLAHFAVDPDLVYLTTHLTGKTSRFLPFNRGRNGGAGNPPSWKGYSTAYLWEETWSRDSVLDLIQNFVQIVDEEDDTGKKTGKKSLLFPRYHQLDSVRRLVADSKAKGPGEHYLIQHSAGSGKSNSIAWLAHQLSSLHDADEQRVFDSIIVITDRRVLDRQLQRTVRSFEQTRGMVENIDTTSRQLQQALEDGKNIVVTTLQKFPVIQDQIGALAGKRFACVIDEAHSSQSGESTKSLKSVLSTDSLEEAAKEEGGEQDDLEDKIVAEMNKRGRQPNVSTFAFTATPKPKTLELFGRKRADGKFEPFSLYTMRQAIEERFILDVLENYTTYKAYWNLLKKIEEDPRYDRKKATALLKAFVDLHEHTIKKKVEIMVEHFVGHTMNRIGGKAKAMIVTRSRLHAVRYRRAVDEYLKAKGYSFRCLVAFSGTVRDGGHDYTEANMNGFPDTQTADTFKRDECKLMVVANKFQTGFDQPLLHTMYVDKKLGGVAAVQTLSRLNRIYPPDKQETTVIDFANEAEDIRKAFEPYYDRTLLSEATDTNLLYDLQGELENFHFYTTDDVEAFARIFFDPKSTQDKLHAALVPVVDRFKAAQEAEEESGTTELETRDFRSKCNDYVRLYAFLSQIITFTDADLEKLYVFCRLLLRKLPLKREQLPVEVQQNIDMDSYTLKQTGSGKIGLDRGQAELEPIRKKDVFGSPGEQVEPLSHIIKELNDRFGTDFTEEDKVFIETLEQKLGEDAALDSSMKVNTAANARLTFDHVANDKIQELIDTNFKFYKQINDDPEFGKFFLDWMFERYSRQEAG